MGKKAIMLIAILSSLTAFATPHNPRNGITDSSLIPSYDTTYTEGRDTFRQIYICNRTEKTEIYILIKNDSIVLWNVDKY